MKLFAFSVLALTLVFLVVGRCAVSIGYVRTASMMPTLRCDDQTLDPDCIASGSNSSYLIDLLTYRLRSPRDGEIVVFRASPAMAAACDGDPEAAGDWVKRVLAVSGETIEGRDGKVYRNGQALTEPYVERLADPIEQRMLRLARTAPTARKRANARRAYADMRAVDNPPFAAVTVPKGYVFVAGDNRSAACDSRRPGFGFVPLSSIVGRVMPGSIGWVTTLASPIAALRG